MDAVRLSRLTTALTVALGGLAAGHLVLPYSGAASGTRRLLFWALVAGIGAWRGWRESVVLEEGERRRRTRIPIYALAAVLLGYVANWVVHGGPHWP